MFTLEYETQIIHYQIIKSNRKTITISILPTKEVIVKAPMYLSNQELTNIVKSKAKWISNKISKMPDHNQSLEKQSYNDGDRILYRGREYMLRVIETFDNKKTIVKLEQEEIVIFINSKQQEITEQLKKWYKDRARELVHERIYYYNTFINKPIGNVRIKNQKKRWGSCSSRGNLNFNWRMILMPDEMFDYIIVHEMCHLKYLNHSKAFWDFVAEIMPDYKKREQWIKLNAYRLGF